MATDPAMVIRIAANLSELRKNLTEGKNLIESTTASMKKMAASLSGDQLIRNAHNITAAINQIGGATKLTAQEAARLEPTLAKAIAKLQALGQGVPDGLRQTQAELKKVADQGAKTQGVLSSLGDSFGRLTAAFTAGALMDRAISSIVSFGREALAAGGRITDMSNKLGVSTEAVQRWSFAAEQTGSNMEGIERAVVQMNDRLANGNESTVKALQLVGLEFWRVREMRTEDAFNAIARAIGTIEDPMTQTRVAMDLFGKSGAEVLPAIKEGLDKLGDAAPIMSDRTISALDRAEDRWNELYTRVTVWSGAIIGYVMDFSAEMDKIDEVRGFGAISKQAARIGKHEMGALPGRAGGLMPSLAPSLKDATAALEEFGRVHGTVDQQLKRATGAEKAAEATKKLRESVEKTTQAMYGLMNSGMDGLRKMPDYIWAFRQAGAVEEARSKAINAIADAIERMNSLVNRTDPRKLASMGNAIGAGDIFNGSDASRNNKSLDTFNKTLAITRGLVGSLAQVTTGAFGQMAGAIGSGVDAIFDYVMASKAAKIANDATAASAASLSLVMAGVTFGISAFAYAFTSQRAWQAEYKQKLEDIRKEAEALGLTMDDVAERVKKYRAALKAAGEYRGPSVFAPGQRTIIDQLNAITEAIDKLKDATDAFGGSVPSSLRPMIDALLKMDGLTDQMRANLEGLAKPSWKQAQEWAAEFGVDQGHLGQGFNQSRLSEDAFKLQRAMDLFGQFQGSNQDGILRGMSDEFSTLAQEAIRTGASLPEVVRPFIDRLRELGLLVDAQGAAIDTTLLTFADIQDEELKKVVALLEQIRELIKATTGPAPMDPTTDPVRRGWLGGIVGKTGGLLPGGAGDVNITIISELDGQAVARNQVRWLTEEARFLQEA